MATGFTDDEILVLLALDAELGPEHVNHRSRAWDAAWWLALSVGALGGAMTLLQSAHLLTPPYFGGG